MTLGSMTLLAEHITNCKSTRWSAPSWRTVEALPKSWMGLGRCDVGTFQGISRNLDNQWAEYFNNQPLWAQLKYWQGYYGTSGDRVTVYHKAGAITLTTSGRGSSTASNQNYCNIAKVVSWFLDRQEAYQKVTAVTLATSGQNSSTAC